MFWAKQKSSVLFFILLDIMAMTYWISVSLSFHEGSQTVMCRALGQCRGALGPWCFLRMHAYLTASIFQAEPIGQAEFVLQVVSLKLAFPLLSRLILTTVVEICVFVPIEQIFKRKLSLKADDTNPLHFLFASFPRLQPQTWRSWQRTSLASCGHVFPASERFQSFCSATIYSWLHLSPRHRYKGAQLYQGLIYRLSTP